MTKDLKAHTAKLFNGIVGQTRAKKEFLFYLDSYVDTRMIPALMIIASIGQGKTTISNALAKGLYEFNEDGVIMIPSRKDPSKLVPKIKTFVEVNCSTLTTVNAFINVYVIPFINDKDVTLFFDEAGEIPLEISNMLLTLLNPNPTNQTTLTVGEYTINLDFKRQSFIFATSESQKVLRALSDRCEKITLQDYSNDDLASIIQTGLPDIVCEDGVLNEIADTVRGNARAAQKMATKMLSYLRGSKTFLKDDWEAMKEILSIAPLGLNSIELNILAYLDDKVTGTSLTCLSAKTGMSRESLRLDCEIYLQRHGLIEITQGGRMITPKGRLYLRDLPKYFVTA